MYGKIFESIYDGTLADHWQALITFQQMIVLCDADGVVDMTTSALARRTGIPIEHIEAGIKILESPDPNSRTKGEDGRRITRLDEHREWGWYIVNHKKYKSLQDADTVREQNRLRKRKQRLRNAGLPDDIDLYCAYCGNPATGPDHVIPQCKGGGEDPENIVPCCPKCNQHKAHRTVQEFIDDPFVTWIDIKRIKDNPILSRHIDCHATVTSSHKVSRHTDTDTNTDKEKTISPELQKNSGPPVFQIPLIDKSNFNVFQHDIDQWQESYPGTDVTQGVRTIRQWNIDNPGRRKTPRGIRRHISQWLEKNQNQGRYPRKIPKERRFVKV